MSKCKHPHVDADRWCPDCDATVPQTDNPTSQRDMFKQALVLLERIEKRRDKSTRAEVRHFLQQIGIDNPYQAPRCPHGLLLEGFCSICDLKPGNSVDIASGL